MKIADQIRRMENALADPEVRKSAAALGAILHPEFIEIGASGRVFDKATIIDLLQTETDFSEYSIEDLTVLELNSKQAHVTYRIPPRESGDEIKTGSWRSSLWVKEEDKWMIRFHQGTRYE